MGSRVGEFATRVAYARGTPYLHVVHPAMEVLNSLLRWVEQQQLLTPLHSSVGGRVNLYADDLVLFITSMSKTYMLSRLHWQFSTWPPASF